VAETAPPSGAFPNAPRPEPEKPLIQFPEALWDDLAKADQALAAKEAGAALRPDGRFVVDFLGAPHEIDPAARLVTAPPGRPRANFQKAMVLLVYLTQAAKANAPDPAGRLIGPKEIPGGAMFFRGPHKLSTQPLEEAYGSDRGALLARAISLGAAKAEDALFRWKVLPAVEIGCYFEEADEEFPALARYSFDAHAHYRLPLDALWALINVVTADLLPPSPAQGSAG
jgi:hypothetical protein